MFFTMAQNRLLGLEYADTLDATRMIEDLSFAFSDPVIIRMGRAQEPEFRPWLDCAWLAGLPLNPLLKRQLLKELYSFDYEPFHAMGDRVIFNYAPNNFALSKDTQILKKYELGRNMVIVVPFQRNYKLVLKVPIRCTFPVAKTQLNLQIGLVPVAHVDLPTPPEQPSRNS